MSFRVYGNCNVWVMDADGSNVAALTDTAAACDRFPEWSKNGQQIYFMSTRDGNEEIYVMDADGSNETGLTFDAGNDVAPETR